MDKIPWLTMLIGIPALGALALCFIRNDRKRTVRYVALGATILTLAVAGYLYAAFDQARGAEFQFEESHGWIQAESDTRATEVRESRTGDGSITIKYSVGLDGIALAMVVLTALLTPLCLVCSWQPIQDRMKGFCIAFLMLEAATMGVFLARDLFLFYVFWEAMLVPMLLLIGIWGGPRRIYASVKFMMYTIAGSLLMLIAVLACYFASKGTFAIGDLPAKLAYIPIEWQCFLFFCFSIAFAIKVPIFPFHTWLPDAHVEAPTGGSVILAGVLLKMGAYGFLRFSLPFFPQAAQAFAPLMMGLAVISIIFGALMSMAQSDIKKLIAYSSVSHLGFVMLGIFSFTEAGGQGAVLQMVNHGLSTGALFLLIGMIYDRTHKRGTEDFGGLAAVMPRYATVFMIVTLSSIGLPGLNGFVGEFLVLKGAFDSRQWAGVLGALGVILGAVYMLKLYRDVFWGALPVGKKHDKLTDLTKTEWATLAPLLALIFVLGVMPNLVLKKTAPAVKSVMEAVNIPTVEPRP